MDFDNGLYVLKFGADWCGPCKVLEPKLKKLEEEFKNISFVSVNIDENPSLAKKYKIRSVPTVILIKDGNEVNRFNGSALIGSLRTFIKTLIPNIAAA